MIRFITDKKRTPIGLLDTLVINLVSTLPEWFSALIKGNLGQVMRVLLGATILTSTLGPGLANAQVVPPTVNATPIQREFQPGGESQWLRTEGYEVPTRGNTWQANSKNIGVCAITTAPGTAYDHVPGAKSENAIDIAKCSDSNVYAPFGGTVHLSVDSAGNHLIIDHGNGYATHFFHLSAFKVKEGAKVNKGDLVAVVGNTGDFKLAGGAKMGVHLHWEVRRISTNKTIPIYGIRGLKFYNAPNSLGFFPATGNGVDDGVAEYTPAFKYSSGRINFQAGSNRTFTSLSINGINQYGQKPTWTRQDKVGGRLNPPITKKVADNWWWQFERTVTLNFYISSGNNLGAHSCQVNYQGSAYELTIQYAGNNTCQITNVWK